MKTSVTTGEVSLRSARSQLGERKPSNLGQMTPNCYLLGGGNDLPTASLGKSIAKTLGRPPLDHKQRVKWEIPVYILTNVYLVVFSTRRRFRPVLSLSRLALLTPFIFLSRASFATDKTISECTVWTINQGCWTQPNAERASSVRSDLLIRAWFKWRQARDYQKEKVFIPIAKKNGALFGGGITVSALYTNENGLTMEQWQRMATRDPFNQIPQAWNKPGIAHGALASEEYLNYCLKWCYAQIDAGVDSLFMDEIEGAYSHRDGFDDASMSKFAAWLTRKYGTGEGWTPNDPRWLANLKIDLTNHAICPDGTIGSFNYRNYLVQHQWANAPETRANPLNSDWSGPDGFVSWRADWAWKYLCDHIHAYGKSKGREVSITANGALQKYVDFQIWRFWTEWLGDRRHLTTMASYLRKDRSAVVNGTDLAGRPVPVVFFHDFGFPGFPFKELSVQDRIRWMKVYAPEIYAAGGFFCWPVDIAQAEDLALIKRYTSWYQDHSDWFHGGQWLETHPISVSAKRVSVAWWEFPALKQRVVHLINHTWDHDIIPLEQVEVQIPSGTRPQRVVWASPEIVQDKPLEFTWANDTVTVHIPRIEGYAALALTYDSLPQRNVTDDFVELSTRDLWTKAAVSRFTVRPDGTINDPSQLLHAIQGSLHPELRNNPTFVADYPKNGQFVIHVDSVAKNGATLNIVLDGTSVASHELSYFEKINDGGEHDQVYAVPVTKGKHEIRVENTGNDWFGVDYYEMMPNNRIHPNTKKSAR